MTTRSFDHHPDTCGCCQVEVHEPKHENRPGQSALDYRIGTHASFLRRMLARLPQEEIASGENEGKRPLADLTTRSPEDPSLAFLDAWATVGDVLTFYQERIANEGFLRTATERRSILELARAIGYELNPGVAASTYLVFQVDESDSTLDTATIPAGTQVQSIPAVQGELPQTFETTAAFEARVEWNALKPRTTEPQILTLDTANLYLHGIGANLDPGDLLLLVEKDSSGETVVETSPRRIRNVRPDAINNRTRVEFESDAMSGAGNGGEIEVFALREKVGIFGHNAPHFGMLPAGNDVDITDTFHHWDNPDWEIWRDSVKIPPTDASDASDASDTSDPAYYTNADIYLERVISGIIDGSWAILEQPLGGREAYIIQHAIEASLAGFAIAGKSTGLELTYRIGNSLQDNSTDKPDKYKVRETTVYVKSELLILTDSPVTTDAVKGANEVTLDQQVEGLSAGQAVAHTGEDADGEAHSEILFLETITESGGLTRSRFTGGIEHNYLRSTVTIHANVVHATHGETAEVLGGGDGAQTNQRFKLRQSPLTYVPAATASGSESTLELRVNGVLWERAPSLYGLGATDQHYMVRINNDAEATVIFGDGKSGARLPTGQENVRANYRAGLGSEGEVGADSLKLLKTRPFGVRDVTNPVAASGAADPEKLDNARDNAPLTVLTLDRVVSLKDFEDFARGFTGIGKAQAVNIWNGETHLVHITIADDDGDPVPEDVRQKLGDAVDAARDPTADMHIDNYELLTFNIEATVQFDSRYLAEDVQGEIEQVLLEAFSFDQRGFGQPVTAAEIISVMQRVDGVIAIDLDELYRMQTDSQTRVLAFGQTKLASVLPARIARLENGVVLPAQLLLINAAGVNLTMKAV